MGIFKRVNSAIKRMKWYDISLVKIASAAFILMVAKLWAPLLILDWYWYLIIAVLASVIPVIKLFGKQ
ncbi:MAG: hypothetical protein ABII01_02480 [Candidatus Woesearchaeota archaeon]